MPIYQKTTEYAEAHQFTLENKEDVLYWAQNNCVGVVSSKDANNHPTMLIPIDDVTKEIVRLNDYVVLLDTGKMTSYSPDTFAKLFKEAKSITDDIVEKLNLQSYTSKPRNVGATLITKENICSVYEWVRKYCKKATLNYFEGGVPFVIRIDEDTIAVPGNYISRDMFGRFRVYDGKSFLEDYTLQS